MLTDRTFPFRRWIEILAWGALASLFVFVQFLPLPGSQQVATSLFLLSIGAYLIVVFHFLFPRSDYAPRVVYLTLVIDVFIVGILDLLLVDYLPNFEMAFFILIVMAAMVADWRGTLALAGFAALVDFLAESRFLVNVRRPLTAAMLLDQAFSVGVFALTGLVVALLAEAIRRRTLEASSATLRVAEIERLRREEAERAAREKTRTLEREQKRASQLAFVGEIAERVAGMLDIGELLNQVTHLIVQRFGFENVSVFLNDVPARAAVLRAHAGLAINPQDIGYRQSWEVGLIGCAARTGKTVVANDVRTDPRYYTDEPAEDTCRAELCVPLKRRHETLGVLDVQSTVLNAFDASDVAAMETLAGQIAVALENARLYAQTKDDAEVKTALLRELSHRVKNSLTAIVGLLHLGLDNEAISRKEILTETLARVQSMAAAHTLLAESPRARVDLLELGRRVVGDSVRQMTLPGHTVPFRVEGQAIEISVHQAASLALVLNELVTNALKHGGNEPSRSLTLTIERADGQVRLELFSRGNVLPAGFGPNQRSGGLGLQLIRTLVEKDLGGNFTLDSREDGVAGVIYFVPEKG